MKKKMIAILLGAMLSTTALCGCGGGSSTASSTVSSAAAETADSADTADEESEAVETADSTDTADEESEAVETTDSTSTGISYVDGYYATDGNGKDFYIVFYENAPGDVAYVNDGTNEAVAEYTVENAQTSDGQDYLLITVGQTQLGYIADGTDGGAYIVDTDGNVYGAQKITEEEADAIYQAVQEAGSANEGVDSSDAEAAADATDVQYVNGFYANDGSSTEFFICFFNTSAGDVAYISDGTNEALASYTEESATTDAGNDYVLVTVGNTQMGFYEDENGNIYIVDADGNTYAGAALSEDEAIALYKAVAAAQ